VLNLSSVYNGQKPMIPVNRRIAPKMYANHIQTPADAQNAERQQDNADDDADDTIEKSGKENRPRMTER
jgi:hypothetical protein